MEISPQQSAVEQDPEKMKEFFLFDVRQKLDKSDDLYHERTNWTRKGDDITREGFEKIMKDSKNPFAGLDGKNIKMAEEVVGVLHVRNEAFPQCVYGKDGNMKCGFFFQVEVEIPAKSISLEEAKKMVKGAIGGNVRIDYLTVSKGIKNDYGGWDFGSELCFETSEFLEEENNS